jgi:hypothetical protein
MQRFRQVLSRFSSRMYYVLSALRPCYGFFKQVQNSVTSLKFFKTILNTSIPVCTTVPLRCSNSNDYVGKVIPSLSRRKHVSNSNEYVGKVVPSLSRRKHVSNGNDHVRKVRLLSRRTRFNLRHAYFC